MDNKLVLIIVAVLLAPLAVFLKQGAGKDLVINILLAGSGSVACSCTLSLSSQFDT